MTGSVSGVLISGASTTPGEIVLCVQPTPNQRRAQFGAYCPKP